MSNLIYDNRRVYLPLDFSDNNAIKKGISSALDIL